MFYFTDSFQFSSHDVKSVLVDNSIHDVEELFEHYRVCLRFPYTTVTNFAAFRDVLTELDWIKESEIRIYHRNLPLLKEQDLWCYIDVLNLIDAEWGTTEERITMIRNKMVKQGKEIPANSWIYTPQKKFSVYFYAKDKNKIRKILDNYSMDYINSIHYDENGCEKSY